jgi:hypothetical protein
MKKIVLRPLVLLAAIALSLSTLHAQAIGGGEVLTNDSVISMFKAGLGEDIIISKIQASKTNFNVSTEELVRLQQVKLPQPVIKIMVTASSSESARVSLTGAGDASKMDPNDPLATHEAGIYLYEEKDGKKLMTQLEPSVSKQTKSGGFLASAMTYGIAKVKMKAALAGANARLQIDHPRPVFYFYFEVKNSGLSNSSYFATNPNEFVLVKMNDKKNTREVTVMQANAFGAQTGTMDKAAQPFDYVKLAPGVYKVTPQSDLPEGEYGFYLGGGAGPSGGAKIFDFGVKRPH